MTDHEKIKEILESKNWDSEMDELQLKYFMDVVESTKEYYKIK